MKTKSSQSGFVLATLLSVLIIVSVLVVTVTSTSIANYQSATSENARKNAQFAADAGLDYGLYQLNLDTNYAGSSGSQLTLLSTTDVRTTYEIEVLPGSNLSRKIIRSTGRTFVPASATTPKATRIFEMEVEGLVASTTSIVAGVGGLVMENSSKIVDGSVFVNGEITMDGTSQIGTNTNPLQVFVANYVCPIPADVTFPRYCNAGENNNPVDIGSPNSYIYGEVSANYQTDDTNMINVNNPSDSALVASSGVLQQDLPVHDRAAMIAAMPYADPATDPGTSAASASCTTNGGSRVWGPNEKITGDVVVSRRCSVEIRGDVWIDGTLTMNNQGEIVVADSLGSTIPVIMIDGAGGFEMNQSSQLVQNSTGVNAQVVTYWSDAACSPDCPNVTGPDLANSQDVPTIDIVNSGGASEAIFYAKWSKVIIRNSVNVGALVGQVVELEQSATIAFSSSLPGFTPRTTWVKKGYLRVYQ